MKPVINKEISIYTMEDAIKIMFSREAEINNIPHDTIENKIKQSEKERKDLAGIRKIARERSKKANLHNKKLRDCRIHLTDQKFIPT